MQFQQKPFFEERSLDPTIQQNHNSAILAVLKHQTESSLFFSSYLLTSFSPRFYYLMMNIIYLGGKIEGESSRKAGVGRQTVVALLGSP